MTSRPFVLFACIHNSGRSVAAKVLTEHYSKGAVRFGRLDPSASHGKVRLT